MADPLTRPKPDAATSPVQGGSGSRRRTPYTGLIVRPVLILATLAVLYLVVRGRELDSIEARYLNRGELAREFVRHAEISVLATLLTVLIAVPLAILLTQRRSRLLRPLVLGLGNLGQAIPSIGLIVLLAEFMGIGFTTALVALVVYAVLPVLRNTIVGLEGVDRTLVEAARGMGMSSSMVLRRVELPLAVPVILAGIRTALVLTVASAVLAAFIGGGGLGLGLVVGIAEGRPLLTVAYGIIVAAVALFADWLGLIAEEVLRPRGV